MECLLMGGPGEPQSFTLTKACLASRIQVSALWCVIDTKEEISDSNGLVLRSVLSDSLYGAEEVICN